MRLLLFFLLSLFSEFSFSQKVDSISIKIIGKWEIYKQTYSLQGKIEERTIGDEGTEIYEFKKDGTYTWFFTNKNNGRTEVYKMAGHWRTSTDSKKIQLYKNIRLLPYKEEGSKLDYDIIIKKLTENEFITPHYFSDAGLGENYYKKK